MKIIIVTLVVWATLASASFESQLTTSSGKCKPFADKADEYWCVDTSRHGCASGSRVSNKCPGSSKIRCCLDFPVKGVNKEPVEQPDAECNVCKKTSEEVCKIEGDPHISADGRSLSGAEKLHGYANVMHWFEQCADDASKCCEYKIQSRNCWNKERTAHAIKKVRGDKYLPSRCHKGDNDVDDPLLGALDEPMGNPARRNETAWARDDEGAWTSTTSCNVTAELPPTANNPYTKITVDLNGCVWLDCKPVDRDTVEKETNGVVTFDGTKTFAVKYNDVTAKFWIDIAGGGDDTNRVNIKLYARHCVFDRATGVCTFDSKHVTKWTESQSKMAIKLRREDSILCEAPKPGGEDNKPMPSSPCIGTARNAVRDMCAIKFDEEFSAGCPLRAGFIRRCITDVCGEEMDNINPGAAEEVVEALMDAHMDLEDVPRAVRRRCRKDVPPAATPSQTTVPPTSPPFNPTSPPAVAVPQAGVLAK